jgi:hypothetical protein
LLPKVNIAAMQVALAEFGRDQGIDATAPLRARAASRSIRQ